MPTNERERWLTAVADMAVRAALEHEPVREALIAFKVEKTPRTRHDLTTALARDAGIVQSKQRERVISFLERTNKFDALVSEAISERMP